MSRNTDHHPYFIWQSDAGLFNLLVYRKYEAEDIQDVLSRDPILRLENYPSQVFQYPFETNPLLFPLNREALAVPGCSKID